jgi:hypothetical protein
MGIYTLAEQLNNRIIEQVNSFNYSKQSLIRIDWGEEERSSGLSDNSD